MSDDHKTQPGFTEHDRESNTNPVADEFFGPPESLEGRPPLPSEKFFEGLHGDE